MADRQLLGDDDLHASAVVANCSMNRERQLAGVNSYTRELGFDPLGVLRAAIAGGGSGAWLDLCCGTGRALVQAATALREEGLPPRAAITGVDLVDTFAPRPAGLPGLQLVSSPVCAWTPSRDAGFSYDFRRHRISRMGKLDAALPYRYLGADDRAGPNYTGQPAVTSHYE